VKLVEEFVSREILNVEKRERERESKGEAKLFFFFSSLFLFFVIDKKKT